MSIPPHTDDSDVLLDRVIEYAAAAAKREAVLLPF
jgi:hypothetical protein